LKNTSQRGSLSKKPIYDLLSIIQRETIHQGELFSFTFQELFSAKKLTVFRELWAVDYHTVLIYGAYTIKGLSLQLHFLHCLLSPHSFWRLSSWGGLLVLKGLLEASHTFVAT